MTMVTWVRMEHHIQSFSTKKQASPPEPPIEPKAAGEVVPAIVEQISSSDEGASEHPYRALTLSDMRTSLFFLYLIQSAFFSVGNIAAISAFSLDSVYRLIPIFDPFSQAALLMYKLMVPFAVISANLGILNRRLGVPPSSLFMVVIAICDVLTLNFFWLVRDEGSWLDIGTSISNFFIASLLCVFVAILEFASEVFISGVEVGSEGQKEKVANGNTGTTAGGVSNAKSQPTGMNGNVSMSGLKTI